MPNTQRCKTCILESNTGKCEKVGCLNYSPAATERLIADTSYAIVTMIDARKFDDTPVMAAQLMKSILLKAFREYARIVISDASINICRQ